MDYPQCIEGKVHKGDYLIEIYRISQPCPGEDNVVYWCKECGAITIDTEMDGRLMRHIRKMEFPKTLDLISKL